MLRRRLTESSSMSSLIHEAGSWPSEANVLVVCLWPIIIGLKNCDRP